MKIDIYKSAKCGDKYLSVPVGTKVETLELPDSIDADLLVLSPLKTRLELDPTRTHPALEQDDIIKQIDSNGYAVHGAKIVINIGK